MINTISAPASTVLLLEWWKPVVGWKDLYMVSNVGRVMRIGGTGAAKRDHALKPRLNNMGYWIVDLCRNAKKRTRLIHRLVADAFLGSRPDDKPYTDHVLPNPWINFASNLEFVTHEENMIRAQRLLRFAHGNRHRLSKLDDDKVRLIRSLQGAMTHQDIADRVGICRPTVTDILNGKRWRHVS
jgi:hypothetical protein